MVWRLSRRRRDLDVQGADERASRLLEYSRTLITAPGVEPITLADLRAHGRIDDDMVADDDQLTGFILAARQRLEEVTGAAFFTQAWRFQLDRFPDYSQPMFLPKPPLQSITSIQYVDTDGTTQTMAASKYVLDTATSPNYWPNRVGLAYNEFWPATREQLLAVTVTAVCGWSTIAAIPATIKQAIKMLALHWYDTRSAAESSVAGAQVPEVPFGVRVLIQEYKVRSFG